MNVVVLIDGREAIPVRAIPFVTGWWLSPDLLARSLAHPDSRRWMGEVAAHELRGGTISGPVPPKEWDDVEDHLQALDATLMGVSNDREQTRPIWLRKSVLLLPARAFVWKDEFEAYFYRVYSPERLNWRDERPGDRELHFSPLISPPTLRSLVLEGFQHLLPAEASPMWAEQPLPSDGGRSGEPTPGPDGEWPQAELPPLKTRRR